MKRSIMVNNMELYWREAIDIGFDINESMEYLLDKMENLGMLPPYSGSDPFYQSRSGSLNDCKWEPEDE
jgi:hypothetical protein